MQTRGASKSIILSFMAVLMLLIGVGSAEAQSFTKTILVEDFPGGNDVENLQLVTFYAWIIDQDGPDFLISTLNVSEVSPGEYKASYSGYNLNDVRTWHARICDADISPYNPSTIDPTPDYGQGVNNPTLVVVDDR